MYIFVSLHVSVPLSAIVSVTYVCIFPMSSCVMCDSFCLSVFMCLCISVSMFLCVSRYVYVCLHVCSYVCLSVCLLYVICDTFVCVCVYLCVWCISVWGFLFVYIYLCIRYVWCVCLCLSMYFLCVFMCLICVYMYSFLLVCRHGCVVFVCIFLGVCVCVYLPLCDMCVIFLVLMCRGAILSPKPEYLEGRSLCPARDLHCAANTHTASLSLLQNTLHFIPAFTQKEFLNIQTAGSSEGSGTQQ